MLSFFLLSAMRRFMKVDDRHYPYLSHAPGYGMCMACVWHVYGMCMVCVWHVPV